MKKPMVSVIVPTKNNESTIEACLKSIQNQSYKYVETIVVDNFSTDKTSDIARRYAKLFQRGPERSSQRNYGVEESEGQYVLIIDSDMELDRNVVSECVTKFQSDENITCIVIPEESFGLGFWANCRKLERSFYVGIKWIEAARAFTKQNYISLGGYNESIVSGEDWDLSQRSEAAGRIDRIEAYIKHNEGRLKLSEDLKKKYYYASQINQYINSQDSSDNLSHQTSPIARYKLFMSNPRKLFGDPLLGLGVLFMKTAEYAFGAVGIISMRFKNAKEN